MYYGCRPISVGMHHLLGGGWTTYAKNRLVQNGFKSTPIFEGEHSQSLNETNT